MSRLILIEPPAVLPVDVESVREHRELVTAERDGLLEQCIRAATTEVEEYLGRALITQRWELRIDWNFPAVIELPRPPCQAVESIKFIDVAGEEQTLDPVKYQVAGIGGNGRAEVWPTHERRWPITRAIPEAVTVTFRAGWPEGDDSPPDLAANIPEPIKVAIMELAGQRFEFREVAITGTIITRVPSGALEGLEQYRMRAF